MPETTDIAHWHRAEVNGLRLFYRRAGEGTPVVLLHGFAKTSHAWRKVMPLLAERHTMIAPDLRGCGASDRPATGYDKRTVASDVRALVDQLGLGPVNLVAHRKCASSSSFSLDARCASRSASIGSAPVRTSCRTSSARSRAVSGV